MIRVRVWKAYKVVSWFLRPMVEAHIEVIVALSVLFVGVGLGVMMKACMGDF